MKKKIIFGLAMLVGLTASLSAQAVSLRTFSYMNNLSEQQFKDAMKLADEGNNRQGNFLYIVNKLPDAIIKEINNNLRGYSLDIGDVFLCSCFYQGIGYTISIRITDTRNTRWQFSARRY